MPSSSALPVLGMFRRLEKKKIIQKKNLFQLTTLKVKSPSMEGWYLAELKRVSTVQSLVTCTSPAKLIDPLFLSWLAKSEKWQASFFCLNAAARALLILSKLFRMSKAKSARFTKTTKIFGGFFLKVFPISGV